MKISYIFTCGRLESLYKILCHIKQGDENETSKEKVIEQYKKDLSLGRSFEETELYQLIEQSEEKIIINRLSNILRDKPFKRTLCLTLKILVKIKPYSGLWRLHVVYVPVQTIIVNH